MEPHEQVLKQIEELAEKDYKKSIKKFIPTISFCYGVRMPLLNKISTQYKSYGLDLIDRLWEGKSFEERMLAVKLLAKQGIKKDKEILLRIERFSYGLEDWAICDTLAMQAGRVCMKNSADELWMLSERLRSENGLWVKRTGIVLMWHFTKKAEYRVSILKNLVPFESSKEKYIKKAVAWIKRDIKKAAEKETLN